MKTFKPFFFAVCVGCLFSISAGAFEFTSQGELKLESKAFRNDGVDETIDENLSFFSRLETSLKFEKSNIRIQTSAAARVDKRDSERDVFYFEEAFIEKDFGRLQVFAGLRTLNWSTSEAFHPSDIVNSRNFDSQFENAEKFGEPMVGFAAQSGDFGIQAFYMPFLTAPKFTSSQNRSSFFPEGFSVANEAFVDQDGRTQEDTAAQWAVKASITKWGGDWSIYWVHHFDRSQPFVVPTSQNTLRPIFLEIDQIGLNLQQQFSNFIFKFEGAQRMFQRSLMSEDFGEIPLQPHTVLAGGLEYIYGWNSGAETSFLGEFQVVLDLFNQVPEGVDTDNVRRSNIFQRDILLGFRHGFNDSVSRELLVLAIIDVELTKQILISASYSQRWKDVWRVRGGLRYIDANSVGVGPSLDLSVFDQDHQIFFELSRFF